VRIHYLQHVPFEGIAHIGSWARERGHRLAGTFVPEEGLPGPGDVDMLVVLGGPMSVHDESTHPWLVPEKALIRSAMKSGVSVLGICLGGQLVADALGARVVRNGEPEIGWFPVRLTEAGRGATVLGALSEEFEALHWHGEVFGVPFGAVKAAQSEACAGQAFEVAGGRVVALQFHLEATRSSAAELIANCPEDLVDAPYVQTAEEILRDEAVFDEANRLMDAVLDAMVRVGDVFRARSL
jgi:GMP synthase (glutamine-hydrolysing)